MNEAIKEGITEEEKTEIAEHLGIRHTHFTFEFKAARHFIDEANERPSFESNGKKFLDLLIAFPAAINPARSRMSTIR